MPVDAQCMPSNSRNELITALKDVGELVAAHRGLTGGTSGRPAARQGAAVTRAGILMLVACLEAYVEDLFEEAAPLVFAGRPAAQVVELINDKVRGHKFANPSVYQTNNLFSALGAAWILDDVKWPKFSNASFISSLGRLITARNHIAHGHKPRHSFRQVQLTAWITMVEGYSKRLDRLVADHIETTTGTLPAW